MLNILFNTMMQQEDNTHHPNSLPILGEVYLARVRWQLLRMEGEEETTVSLRDEVVTNMAKGKNHDESSMSHSLSESLAMGFRLNIKK